MTKMSSSAVRLITNSSPSSDSSSPAAQPSRLERVIRRAIRATSRIDSDPTTATANRQPNGLRPKIHSPAAMRIFPNGGWTTNSPPLAKMCWSPRAISVFRLLM